MAVAGVAMSLGVAGFIFGVRPRLIRWGATPTEAAAPLPGDHLVEDARLQFTRAITVRTPVSRVWPWLVQMGAGRGGLYSYDAFENSIGLGIHSSDRILPEFQDLKVGDAIPLHPNGGIPVRLLEPEAVLGLGGTMNYFTGPSVRPARPHRTRVWT